MPEGLVLTMDPNVIHKVDTANMENLYSMWTVLSRCADSVEQGRRLENMFWRLWNRETFCCDADLAKPQFTATTSPKDIPTDNRIADVPQLSGSVDSVVDDEEALDLTSDSDPVEIGRPRVVRQDSSASSRSRGRGKHITSDHLEKMVVSIIEEKEPNLAPLNDVSSPSIEPESDSSQGPFSPETQETLETPETEPLCHSAELAPESSTSQSVSPAPQAPIVEADRHPTAHEVLKPPKVNLPERRASPAPVPVQFKKQPARFALGGSSGSDDSSPQSLEVRHQRTLQPPKKGKMFSLGGSSGSGENNSVPSLKSAMHSARPNGLLSAQKKQTSFSNQVTMRTIHTPTDQSDSYVDESAIDDDDEDSEWEDSIEESGKSSLEDPVTFKRIPSKVNLPSQRSLISLMLAAEGSGQRPNQFGGQASQSTSAIPRKAVSMQNVTTVAASPSDSDDNGLEMKRDTRHTPLKPITEAPRRPARPILTTTQSTYHQAPLSPKTARTRMIATELSESLRRNILWERHQKTSTANAVMKRRHTAHDVANLKQYPGQTQTEEAREEANASSSWNQYLNRDTMGGYHAQGW